MHVLSADQWSEAMAAHTARANDRLARFRHPGEYHPVYDFLFEYYPVRPSHLRRWHPGVGVALAPSSQGSAQRTPPHAEWRDYTTSTNGVTLDVESFFARRSDSVRYMRDLIARSRTNPAQFDCFGLHEWAMLYHADTPRHDLPLRLGRAGTNQVVDTHRIKCTHYDAFRFFTPPARSLNLTVLTREGQPASDQPGCVHATMDLYKWAWKLGPLVPGELFLDALDLAIDARVLDMEASPYDCRGLGFGVVPIETPAGKTEYVRRQRDLARRAEPIRDRLVALIDHAEAIRMNV